MTPYPFTSDLWATNEFGEGVSLVLVPYQLLILPQVPIIDPNPQAQRGLLECSVSQTKVVVHEGEREICGGKGVGQSVRDQGS